jgi:hypothetical protein
MVYSIIDEILKFCERKFYMRTTPADQRYAVEQNGAVRPKKE